MHPCNLFKPEIIALWANLPLIVVPSQIHFGSLLVEPACLWQSPFAEVRNRKGVESGLVTTDLLDVYIGKFWKNFGKFWIIISKVGGKSWRRGGYMEQYLSDQNQLHIFDNDNFSIIPKSIFSDNDNLPISCKNAEISAADNFFDNIAHP